jgi:hypothetical protein
MREPGMDESPQASTTSDRDAAEPSTTEPSTTVPSTTDPKYAVDASKNLSSADKRAFDPIIRELRTINLFSWNLWFGGREIDDAVARQKNVLQAEDIDILFLQECFGTAALRIGRATGMSVAQQDYDCAVLSPSPLRLVATDTTSYATAAIVQTRQGDVLAWSVHLVPWDYGPYRADELPGSSAEVFAQPGERSRTAEAQKILAETQRILAESGDMPVIIAGDFNVPSPQDWNGTQRPDVTWPATQQLLEAGYTDAFRAVHPDAAKAPGLTWSQIEPLEKEPRDRIDFVFLKGFTAESADHLGGAADDADTAADAGFVEYGGRCEHIPDQRGNAFPSDHLAVRATARRQD